MVLEDQQSGAQLDEAALRLVARAARCRRATASRAPRVRGTRACGAMSMMRMMMLVPRPPKSMASSRVLELGCVADGLTALFHKQISSHAAPRRSCYSPDAPRPRQGTSWTAP